MARPLADLVSCVGRETSFPEGAVLLTGTGMVPPDAFTLTSGDEIVVEVTGIGRLVNPVEGGRPARHGVADTVSPRCAVATLTAEKMA